MICHTCNQKIDPRPERTCSTLGPSDRRMPQQRGFKKTGRGSQWRRWEPHIHAPGTVMNNQFKGPSAWEDYISALEAATPAIEAVAVTDYYVTETYEQVLDYKKAGRLPTTKLIFPNVELRLDVAAKKGFVNIHLLVCPDEADHLDQLKRFLARLSFRAFDDRFDCTRKELRRLGKRPMQV